MASVTDPISALFVIGVLIILGTAGGECAKKLRLPALTGQIIVGILLGSSFLNLFSHHQIEMFNPLVTFALSLIAVTIGGHLEFRRLHNAKRRIFIIAIVQTFVTFAGVFGLFHWLNPLGLEGSALIPVHLLIASIATSTTPVTTMHVIKDKRARGLLVKTTIAVVAVNNLLTLALFATSRAIATEMIAEEGALVSSLAFSLLGILLALVMGGLTGSILVTYCRYLRRKYRKKGTINRHDRGLLQGGLFTALLVTMCVSAGLCEMIPALTGSTRIHPSPILANMMVGLVLANRSSFKEELLSLFDVLEIAVFALFFVLAGLHFDPDAAKLALVAAMVYFGGRLLFKQVGGVVGGYLGGSSPRLANNMGNMLTAQGAIAIALLIVIQQDGVFGEYAGMITACILTGVVAAELLGGPLIGLGLDRAKETKRDRTRLIEFLQEEFIIPNLHAQDKWSVLEELSYFLKKNHPIKVSQQELIELVKEREESLSTAIGEGIAVPHARLPEGDDIHGIMALLDPPVDFDALDGIPVRLVVMIATPEGQDHKHLEVIAAISRMMQNPEIREAIFEAKTAEQIHEIIDSEEAETFNYFVET